MLFSSYELFCVQNILQKFNRIKNVKYEINYFCVKNRPDGSYEIINPRTIDSFITNKQGAIMMFSTAIRQWNVVFKQTYFIIYYMKRFFNQTFWKISWSFAHIFRRNQFLQKLKCRCSRRDSRRLLRAEWKTFLQQNKKIQVNNILRIELKRERKFSSRFLVKPTWEL